MGGCMGERRDTMSAMSRRRFLQVAGAAMALAALPAVGGRSRSQREKRIRIRPFPPQAPLSPSQRAFFDRAQFETAADAMRAVASRGVTAEIYVE